MKPFRILWRLLLIVIHLLTAIAVVAFGNKIVVDGEKQLHPDFIRWWSRRLCRIFRLQLTVTGATPTQTALVVANHISWLDIVVLHGTLHTSFLSKAEVGDWPLVGWLSRATGTIFIKRGEGQSHAVREAIAHRLKGDQVLTLFPEGKTSDGAGVGNFFPRLLGAAIDADIPVLPAAIRYEFSGQRDLVAPYTNNQSLLSNALGMLGRRSSTVRVHLGTPIPVAGADRRQLASTARQHIIDALAQYPH